MTRLELWPVFWSEAKQFVAEHHRHHLPPRGHIFSLGAARDGELAGVAIVGRPTSYIRQDGFTCEVTRLCVHPDEKPVIGSDGREHAPAVCSYLYNAAKRAAMALGYAKIGTYTLKREPGTSLVAAEWVILAETKGRSWNSPSRPRTDKHPTEDKLFWAPRTIADRDRLPYWLKPEHLDDPPIEPPAEEAA